MVHAKDRYPALKRIADCYPDMYALVFCRTRAETSEVADKLMKDGYNADALHGDLSQAHRDRVMDKFRNRSLQMLVATDVAARGVDVSDLTHVINYNLPDDAEIYTHRSGRTGRAGKKGIALSIIHMKEKYRIKRIEKIIRKKFKEVPVPTGKSICEAQLFSIVNRVKNVDVNHEQIAPYLPAVFETLEGMEREELIKHLVSVEFNRFLDYYKNTPDLTPGHISDNDKSNFERLSGSKIASFYFNVGRKDGLTPKKLLQVINDNCREKINVGRIKINDAFSLVEVSAKQKKILTEAMNDNILIGDRVLNIRPDTKPEQSSGSSNRKRRKSGGGRDSRERSYSDRRSRSARSSGKPSRKQRKKSQNASE
jgi:ATP-dependent RNA helicase DeaD